MQRVIERILNLLAFLLTAERAVTAEEIRNTVAGYDQESDEAFRRTFERDKELLRSLGVPLRLEHTDAWEVEQGYVVAPDEYALPDPGLTDEERVALLLATRMVRLGGQAPGLGAIFKLGGAPASGGGEPFTADLDVEAGVLATLFQAIVERRRLSFEYNDAARTVHPLGLIHRIGHWYLVAERDGQLRRYRVDRMSAVESGRRREAFSRPKRRTTEASFPDAPWEAGDDDMTAVIRFDPGVAWWARRRLPRSTALREERDGGLVATFAVANPSALIGWLLDFDDAAEVLGPPELRAAFLEHLGATA